MFIILIHHNASYVRVIVFARLTMSFGGILLKLSIFCLPISLWGVIMLLVLGICCKLRAVALFEDVHIKEGGPNGTDPDVVLFEKDNVDDGYNNAAW